MDPQQSVTEEENKMASGFLAYKNVKNVQGALMAVKQKQAIKAGNIDTLFKTVRELYKKPKVRPTKGDKVVRRTTETYITDIDDDYYQTKRARQLETIRVGHFSECWEPYETLGTVVLEPYELIWETLDQSLPKNFMKDFEPNRRNLAHLKYMEKKKEHKTFDNGEFETERRACQSAGMNDIRSLLEETERRIVACRAGQPYSKHVQDSQEAKAAEKTRRLNANNEGTSMVLKRLSSADLSSPGLESIRERRQTITRKDKLFIIQTSQNFSKLGSYKKNLKVKAFTEKLNDIYIVLCSLQNIRTRHLKSKATLNLDVVKALRRDPFAAREGTISQPSKRPESHDARSSRIGNAGSIAHPTTPSDHSRLASATVTMTQVSKNTAPSMLVSYMKNRGMNRRKTIKLTKSDCEDAVKLETWDDLVNLGTKKNILRMFKKLPPWQQTYLKDGSSTMLSARRRNDNEQHSELYHTESTVNRCKLNLIHTKQKVQKSASATLDRVDKEQLVMGRHKLSAFDEQLPLFEHHKETLRAVTKMAHKHIALLAETPEWYESLVQEAVNISALEDPGIEELLNQLEKFVSEDIRTVHNAREKMALLVMSLPVYDVCTTAMLSALKFVLKDILNADTKLLKQWLDQRHLYLLRN